MARAIRFFINSADAIETVRVCRAQLVIATARLSELLEGHD